MLPDDEESRLRSVFSLPRTAPIPTVDYETLMKYRACLLEKLAFPFEGLYAETAPPVRRLFHYVSVVGLSGAFPSLANGLLCRIQNADGVMEIPLSELGVREDNPIHDVIEDYAYWFWNWR